MKKVICLLSVLIFLLCGCTQTNQPVKETGFTKTENGNLISDSGVEYAHLANEGSLYYLSELEFVGSIQGEEETSGDNGIITCRTGLYAIKNNNNILIRRTSDSQWFSIYRKTSLPPFDISPENCIRLEFVSGNRYNKDDSIHTTCNGGISDKNEITDFFSEIRLQKSPRDSGLYNPINKAGDFIENCYVYGVVYSFFKMSLI